MINEYAVYESLFGNIKLVYEDRLITMIQVTREEAGSGQRTELTDLVNKQLTEYFIGVRRSFDFPYKVKGTEFQIKVWDELLKIPYGETRTYKEIAKSIGNPNASRAVGGANNKNPIAIAIPCHRVVGSNGKLVGYAGGLDMKKGLLELEKNHSV